jgi:hypothetical protein
MILYSHVDIQFTQYIIVNGSGGRCTEVFVFLCLTSDYLITQYTSHDLTFVYSAFKTPDSPHKWLQVAEEYENLWNFPLCVGALDGKHIELQAPFKNGSEYCTGTFSIVLLAAVNATHSFFRFISFPT